MSGTSASGALSVARPVVPVLGRQERCHLEGTYPSSSGVTAEQLLNACRIHANAAARLLKDDSISIRYLPMNLYAQIFQDLEDGPIALP